MPVVLSEFIKTLTLPDGVSAELAYNIDGIRIWKDGKWIGTIGRKYVDDNLAEQKLKEILDDSDQHGERVPGPD